MLIRFNVKNFLSFASRIDSEGNDKTEEFSMLAGKVRSKLDHVYENDEIKKLKLLKFAAVYGANAAGKSNLVKAMDFMRTTVVRGGMPQGHSNLYCKANDEYKEKPSYFEMEILLNDKIYAYGFEACLSKSRFLSEWLFELTPDGNEKEIFTRDISAGVHNINTITGEAKNSLDVYAEGIDGDDEKLFLSLINKSGRTIFSKYNNAAVFSNVYQWFKKTLVINYPDKPISDYSYLIRSSDNITEIEGIINAFGTGITNVEILDVNPEDVLSRIPKEVQKDIIETLERIRKEINEAKDINDVKEINGLEDETVGSNSGNSKKKTKSNISVVMRSNRDLFVMDVPSDGEPRMRTVKFHHGDQSSLFDLSEESDGTVRLLDLLEILISGKNRTYVIDELDRCLHPCLTYKYVETFLQEIQRRNIQLIVTTHESRLLDFDLLRRDEIWFANKRQTGETDLYSLEEYNARFDQKIDKAYLDGRYGGVPIFTTVFPVKEE